MLVDTGVIWMVIVAVALRCVGPIDAVAGETEQVGVPVPELGDTEQVRLTVPAKLLTPVIVAVVVVL